MDRWGGGDGEIRLFCVTDWQPAPQRRLQGAFWLLGIESNPVFPRAPAGNGWAEEVVLALLNQRLWLGRFATGADRENETRRWAELCIGEQLLKRNGFRSPVEARRPLHKNLEDWQPNSTIDDQPTL